MESRYLYLFRLILASTDFLLVNISFFISYYVSDYVNKGITVEQYGPYFLNINLLWLLSSNALRLYHIKTIKSLEYLYRATWKSICIHIIFLVFYLLFSKEESVSRFFLILFYLALAFNFLLSRFICTIIEPVLVNRYKIRKSVAVMGSNATSLHLATFFRSNYKQYHFEGFLNSDNAMYVDERGELLPGTCAQIKKAADTGIKEVFVTLSPDHIGEAGYLLKEAEKQCVRLKFVPDFSQSFSTPFNVNYMGGFPVISLRKEPLEDIENRFRKRLFDIVFSLIVILFILSWLYPVLALIIQCQSRGPVLFKQLRSGRDNKFFWCYKFRSMTINADSDQKQASRNDGRTTPVGRFLRRTSLDELPQFFNVLMGNMSVIGPRPHMLKHTEEYRALIDRYMVRHYLKPGISGWAQVNGFRGETKSLELMQKRVEHDIWYLENWSLMLDIKIIFMTIINIIRGEENAY